MSQEVWSIGFGAPKPGSGSYPSIYIVGWVKVGGIYTFGIWRSDDHHSSWIKIGDGYPNGNFDQITTVEGDANVYGRVYVGFHGSRASHISS